uniref:WDR59/RTC1-like RING zinc finger domain-containing protein n=1 Tax=Octactis speculum TaxID=3111310 RepID=A0A7S2FTR9_9STRA|mmetsp:Transcript_31132/g.42194  ORF Transcript_31132/g.42194 Transcript_31132/m.42194 type:complete len:222 (+) Transcript_31132:3-668(+)
MVVVDGGVCEALATIYCTLRPCVVANHFFFAALTRALGETCFLNHAEKVVRGWLLGYSNLLQCWELLECRLEILKHAYHPVSPNQALAGGDVSEEEEEAKHEKQQPSHYTDTAPAATAATAATTNNITRLLDVSPGLVAGQASRPLDLLTPCLDCGKLNCFQCGVKHRCVLCREPVLGLMFVCMTCGHGGHEAHIRSWFRTHDECAAGCGCNCFSSVLQEA